MYDIERIFTNLRRISELEKKRAELFSEVASPKAISLKPDVVQASCAVGSPIENYLVKCEEIDQKLSDLKRENLELQAYVMRNVHNLPSQMKEVVYRRYILLEPWNKISDDMGCGLQWLHKLKSRAKRVMEEQEQKTT